MEISLWVWVATVLVVLGLLIFDFFAHVRVAHVPSLKEASWWSVFYITVAVIFGGVVWLVWGPQYGAEYFAGYVTEKSLSVDNLFVFILIMGTFAVPPIYQQKVLLVGIAVALVMRGIVVRSILNLMLKGLCFLMDVYEYTVLLNNILHNSQPFEGISEVHIIIRDVLDDS